MACLVGKRTQLPSLFLKVPDGCGAGEGLGDVEGLGLSEGAGNGDRFMSGDGDGLLWG